MDYEIMWKKLKAYIRDYKDCELVSEDLLTIMDDCEKGDYSSVEESPEEYTRYRTWCLREGVTPEPYEVFSRKDIC